MAQPVVAIVGRPNVGKSTLFNRIVGGRIAIVEDTPGVTRDRIYQEAEWLGRRFILVDTGGIVEGYGDDSALIEQVRLQAQLAIEEAEVILFIVDSRAGVLPDDLAVANLLRKTAKPVLLVANKVEQFTENYSLHEFFGLGLGEPISVSAAHGMNIGDLLDLVIEKFPTSEVDNAETDITKIALIGRPNVGKSSLLNYILGENRSIVSNIPGTTRDAIDSTLEKEGHQYLFIDTAGIRRKSKVVQSTERYSVLRSVKAVDRCDVALIVIDAQEGITDQDKRIAGLAHEAGKSSIIVINKWDLIKKDDKTMDWFDRIIRQELSFMLYAPTMYISAKTGQRVGKLLELVDFVNEQAAHRIATGVLNQYLAEIISLNPPPSDKGRTAKFLYMTQAGTQPPRFIIFVNNPDLVHFSYKRYLENKLREAFGFEGNPIRIIFKQRD